MSLVTVAVLSILQQYRNRYIRIVLLLFICLHVWNHCGIKKGVIMED